MAQNTREDKLAGTLHSHVDGLVAAMRRPSCFLACEWLGVFRANGCQLELRQFSDELRTAGFDVEAYYKLHAFTHAAQTLALQGYFTETL